VIKKGGEVVAIHQPVFPLFADTGIPLIGGTIFLGWFALIPVALIEAIMAVWMLRWRFPFAAKWVFLANAFSMLLGIPITWFLVTLLQMCTGGGGWGDGSVVGVLRGPAWLGPGYIPDLRWAIPLGLIILCVPFFFMSWWLEYVFLYAFAGKLDKDAKTPIRRYAWKANLASYSLLVALLIVAMFC
jgi:hypothetical protein